MICSQPSSFGSHVGDELHELVGLPVEVQVVERLQRERRVAHPGVAVVPVALAARRLRERRGERRHRRPGRHVRQSLDRQRRALDRVAPAVVGDARPSEPRPPEARRRREPLPRPRRRRRVPRAARPTRARSTPRSPGLEDVPCPHAVALDAEREVRLEADRLSGTRRVGRVPAAVDQRPRRRLAAVAEHGLADELDLDASPRGTRRCAPACGRRRRPPAAACAA